MTISEVEVRRRPIPVDTFAARLKLTRLHAGDLTIMEAAERCGLVNQSWSNWERGRLPRDHVEVVEIISETLDVDFDWLLRGGPLAVAQPLRRRRGRTSAYGLARTIVRDRPQTSDSRPATYGASRRPTTPRVGAVQRRRGAAV